MAGDKKFVKENLKNAKECIDKKEYKEGLKFCKKVISEDKKNYYAFVFVGFCYKNLEQYENSEQAYLKAISFEEKSKEAWLGLIELYNENFKEGTTEKLTEAYLKMIDYYKDSKSSKKYFEMIQGCLLVMNDSLKKVELNLELLQKCETEGEKYFIFKRNIDIIENFQIHNSQIFAEEQVKKLIEKLRQEDVEKMTKKLPRGSKIPKKEDSELLDEVKREEQMKIFRQEFQEKLILSKDGFILDKAIEKVLEFKDFFSADIYKKYIQRMIKRHLNNFNEITKKDLVEHCLELIKSHGNSLFALKELLLFSEEDDDLLSDGMIEKLKNKIIHGHPSYGISNILLSEKLFQFQLSDFDIIETLLETGLKKSPFKISGWITNIKLSIKREKFKKALNLIQKTNEMIIERETTLKSKLEKFKLELKVLNGLTLLKMEKLNESEKIFKDALKIDKEEIIALKSLGEIEFLRNNFNLSKDYLNKVISIKSDEDEAYSMLGWIFYIEKDFSSALEQLKMALKYNNTEYLYHYRIGRIYWELDEKYQSDKNYCQNHWLISAKLNSNFPSNFVQLGNYYEKINDHKRAIQCYKKAISLNSMEEEPGKIVGNEYERLGEYETAINLYKQITKKNIHATWAWKRLAFAYLYKNNFDDSLTAFLSIIREDPTDAKCWEGLGYVYEKQGKYLASLKAFNRAIELDSSLIHSETEICNIQRILGNFSESKYQYEQLILKNPENLMAYKGLSDTLFEVSKNYFRDGVFVKCALELLKSNSLLQICSKKIPNFEIIWKCLGDVNSYFYMVPEKAVREALKIFNSSNELKSFYLFEDLKLYSNRIDFIKEGSKNYQKYLQLNPNNSNTWYDLGINTSYQYLLNKSNGNLETDLLNVASDLFKKSIYINPNESKYWNGLGFTQEDPKVKQHCFIRSIEKDPRNHSGWNNLGILYLQFKEYDLAKECFINSQNLNPSSIISWIGLGVINENVKSSEGLEKAAAAFYHAQQIGTFSLLTELGVGYTSYMTNDSLKSIHSLTKYLQFAEKDFSAWNLLGLVLEQQKKYEKAAFAFKKCVEYLSPHESDFSLTQSGYVSNSNTITDSKQSLSDFHKLANINLARCYFKAKKFEESYNVYLKCVRFASKDIGVLHYFSLVCFELKKFDESISHLKESLEISPNDEDKAILFNLLGIIYFKIDNSNQAMKYLQQCIEEFPSFTNAYLTLASILIFQNKSSEGLKILNQLNSNSPQNYTIESFKLESDIHLMNKHPIKARNTILRAIHLYPMESILWDYLAEISIFTKIYSKYNIFTNSNPMTFFSICQQIENESISEMSESFSSKQYFIRRLLNIAFIYYTIGFIPYSSTSEKAIKNSLSLTQKILMFDPENENAKKFIPICLHAKANITQQTNHYFISSLFLKDLVEKKEKNEKLEFAYCEDLIGSQQFAECMKFVKSKLSEKVLEPNYESNMMLILSNCLYSKNDDKFFKFFENSLKKDEKNFKVLNNLGDICIRENRLEAAETCFLKSEEILSKQTKDVFERESNLFNVYGNLGLIYFKLKNYPKSLKYNQSALKINPESPGILLIQGKSLFENNDFKTSKTVFEKCLKYLPKQLLTSISIYKIHYKLESWEDAENDLWFEKSNLPGDSFVLYNLAVFAFESGMPKPAYKCIQQAIHLDPTRKEYWNFLKKNKFK